MKPEVKKRVLSLLTAVGMAVSLLCVPASAYTPPSLEAEGRVWVLGETYGGDPNHDHYFTYENSDHRIICEDCSLGGVSLYICRTCGAEWVNGIQSPSKHKFSLTSTRQPTDTEPGERIYSCSYCSVSYSEPFESSGNGTSGGSAGTGSTPNTGTSNPGSSSIGTSNPGSFNTGTSNPGSSGTGTSGTPQAGLCARGHSWAYSTIDPTCTQEGHSVRTCSVCGTEEVLYTRDALGHQYTAAVTKQATPLTAGVRTFTCDRCGDSYTESIPALGGSSESPVVRDPGAAAVQSNNYGNQNYSTSSATMKSYLYQREDGNFTRVEAVDGKVVIEVYDQDFQLLTSSSVPMELDTFGGFHAGQGYNFLVFGRNNSGESNSQEVVRVVKYSKDWDRLGQASLTGANTETPFRSSSLRCAEYNGMLYIITSHRMFKSSDGLNHQANMFLSVRESDMAITDSYYSVSNIGASGYVSHSFNQFIIVDNQGRLVALNHGDAYPRAAVLYRYPQKAGGEKFIGRGGSYVNVMTFQGATGENATGASLGGLAASESNYLTVGNTVIQDSSFASRKTRNVVLTVTGQQNMSNPKTVQLTNYPDDGQNSASTPQLVKISDDRFLVLWDVQSKTSYGFYSLDGTIAYAFVNGSGVQQGQTYTAQGYLSDCQPILAGGKVVWYTTNQSAPVFYTLDAASGTLVQTGSFSSGEAAGSTPSTGSGTGTAGSTPSTGTGSTTPSTGTGSTTPSTGSTPSTGTGSGTTGSTPSTGSGSTRFSDVPVSHWAYDWINTAAVNGWVSGMGDGTYGVDRQLTYAEFSTMLVTAFYSDERAGWTGAESPWYVPYLEILYQNGVLQGSTLLNSSTVWQQNTYVNTPANRYEMARLIYRILAEKGSLPTPEAIAQAEKNIADWASIPREYSSFVAASYASGLLSGMDSIGTFGGSQSMTRAQAAVVLCKLVGLVDAG